jgi:hypothetical protein
MERHDTTRHGRGQTRITAVYLEATFRLVEGEDPVGFYLDAYTDTEDAFVAHDLISDWLMKAQRKRRCTSPCHPPAAPHIEAPARWEYPLLMTAGYLRALCF